MDGTRSVDPVNDFTDVNDGIYRQSDHLEEVGRTNKQVLGEIERVRSKDDVGRIKALAAVGLSDAEIAEKTGVPEARVRVILDEAMICSTQRPVGQPREGGRS